MNHQVFVQEAIDQYLNDYLIEQQFSQNTRDTYRYVLTAFSHFLQERKMQLVSDIDSKILQDYLKQLDDEGFQSSTKAHHYSTISSFFSFVCTNEREHLKNFVNPCFNVPRPKREKHLPESLTLEEVNQLLDIDLHTPFDYRNKAMLELLYATGMRVSEMVQLRLNDIDLENCVVLCFGKGKKERIIPLGEYCVFYLEQYLQVRPALAIKGSCDALFLNNHGEQITRKGFYKLLQGILKKQGITAHVSPHTLRHTFATHMLDGGANLRSIQELLGHSDLSTTRIYTHTTNQKLKEDYDTYHPRNHMS